MTREFINRIVSRLIEYRVNFVVTGSVSKYLRGETISTLDLDAVVAIDATNLSRIDEMGKEFQIEKGMISRDLEKGRIVRIKLFPFTFDLLPKLDGLNTMEIFENREQIQFDDKVVPVIAESDLAKNYNSFCQI